MMKRITTLILSMVSICATAQVTINIQLPPGGMVQKEQLWNLVLMNNSNSTIEAIISLDIQDAVTGQTVLSAVAKSFSLGKGVKVISSKNVQPVQYNYVAAELNCLYIPLGNYIACYRVSKETIKGPEPVADECARLNIAPLSPPLLNTPGDHSVLETVYPQFSWLPPAPVDMFSNLNYDLVVAEVQEGQTPAEAVLSNNPVYSTGNLKNSFLNYPSTFSKLKTGQQYAWQVTARNGSGYAAQTETWSFSVKGRDSVKTDALAAEYILLKDGNDPGGIYTITGNMLQLKFYSFEKKYAGKLSIVDDKGKLVMQAKQEVLYGDNFITFKLSKKLDKGIIYRVSLTDPQNKIYNSRFIIR